MSENHCPFRMLVGAKVIRTWRDDDGYGNEDSDYLTMSLKIPTWPEGNTLLARIKNTAEESPPMVEGKMYAIRGGFYFKVPQKRGHRGYLCITSQKEVPEVSEALAQEAGHPIFEVVCNVSRVKDDDKIGLIWRCWDDYEIESYGQSVMTPYPLSAKAEVEENLDKLWKISGRMAGPKDLQLRGMESTVSPV